MTLRNLLQEKKVAIVQRWLEEALATHGKDTAAFFNRSKDQFANPIGHAMRVGAQAVFENLLEGMEPDRICQHLEGIIKIRAVQDFSPSQAVSFIFLLKKVVRAELGKEALDSRRSVELTEFDAEVDQLALFAFDIFTRCREQLYEVRVNEVKRSVAAIMKRFHGSPDPTPYRDRFAAKPKCTST